MKAIGLKLETIKKEAAVFFPDESRLDGFFFTAVQSPNNSGHERVSELLNGKRSYLPFELSDGGILVIQREGIMMVALTEREQNESFPYPDKIHAQVGFLTGQTIDGTVYTDLPKTHTRLSDFLNQNLKFFYLEVRGRDYLINSRFIKTVRN